MAVTSPHPHSADPADPAEPVGNADTAPGAGWPAGRGRRLVSLLPADRTMSWVWALLITGIGAALRFHNIARPGGKIFDEVYYAHDSLNLLRHGVELNVKNNGPGFVVHPPMGKWLIAIGEQIFGDNPLGWRFSAAVIGSLSILVLIRLGRRMFGSTLLGCLAGILISFDGLHFVQSRISMLDIFLMWWVLAMFACLLIDRDSTRARLALLADAAAEQGADLSAGVTKLGMRWWRLAATLCAGMALATKWDAIWYVLAFGALTLVWDIGAWRSAGVRHPVRDAVLSQGPRLVGFGVPAFVIYVASFVGWFANSAKYAYDRDWASATGHHLPIIPDALISLFHYQREVLTFHASLSTPHPYQSQPWSWLLLGRPVSFYYQTPTDCGAARCAREVLDVGNPILWWPFLAALVAVAWLWLAHRDWRGAAILTGVGAGILPWLPFPDRTMFFFYALPALPFLVLATTAALAMVLELTGARPDSSLGGRDAVVARSPAVQTTGAVAVGLYVIAVIAAFVFFYPILAGVSIPYEAWDHRIWLPTWI